MTALAVLVICTADARNHDRDPIEHTIIELTVNEIRRLINTVIITPIRSLAHRLHWSGWRRQHQNRARRGHCTRRLNLELQP